MKKLLIGLVTAALSTGALANTIGLSNQPLLMKKHIVTTEFNNYRGDSGTGLTARYLNKVNDIVNIVAGTAHSSAIKSNGEIISWGSNELGQLDPIAGLSPAIFKGANLEGAKLMSSNLTAVDFSNIKIIERGLLKEIRYCRYTITIINAELYDC